MGNQSSQPSGLSNIEVVRRPPERPNVPPSSRPVSALGPKGPSYLDPENQVLPKELPSTFKLRPISMELNRLNPEYGNIYGEERTENGALDDNENNIEKDDAPELSKSPPRPPPPPMANGHANGFVDSPNNSLPNGHGPTGATPPNPTPTTSTGKTPYRPSHRRQMSLGQPGDIILEEPEEIDSRVKLDPLMQSFPGATGPSLPVKNNFNLDYAYQLTYVQLAEHRRNKTIEELEKKTGKKLSDLSAELNENSTDRQMFVREAQSRASTKSSGTGVSSKKKKAPAPPGQATTPGTPRKESYSVDNEPPIDYDMESPRRPINPVSPKITPKYTNNTKNGLLPRYSAAIPPVSRVLPSVSKVPQAPRAPQPPAIPPAPKIPGQQTPKKAVNLSRNNSMNETPHLILKKTPDLKPAPKTAPVAEAPVPWLLEIKNLSEAKAARRQLSMETTETPDFETDKLADKQEDVTEDNVESKDVGEPTQAKAKLIFASSTENDGNTEQKDLEALRKPLERSSSFKENESPKAPSPKLQRHSSTTTFDRLSSPMKQVQRQQSVPTETKTAGDPVRRLSSLLQHDIKAAGNAKCLKLVKQTTPTPPKPKDPHTVFREQLQKACLSRDQRAAANGSIDEQLQRNNSNASFDLGEVIDDDKVKEKLTPRSSNGNDPPEVLPKPPRYHKNVTLNRNSNVYTKRASSFVADKPQTNSLQRQQRQGPSAMSMDWTPEADLDSDDNISDREEVTRRKGSSDGFKSSIIPNQMSELKTKKKGKDKKNKVPNGAVPVDDVNNKNKFGSVKKFKKTMHKSVKNAFGSISKASGKLLRKQKAEDLEMVEDPPKNWSMTANRTGYSSRQQQPQFPFAGNGHDQECNSDSDIDEEQFLHEHELTELSYRQNGHMDSEEEESSEAEAASPELGKRASMYRTNKVPQGSDHEDVEIRGQGSQYQRPKVSKASKKSKKLVDTDELLAAREQERRMEEDRRRQLEKELEMHRLREAETRERLQRLETAHLQQLTAQLLQQQQQQQHQQQHHHQQQQQNLSMLPAPPLPAQGSYPNYGTLPEPSHNPNYTNLFNQQVPQNGFPPNYAMYSQSNPYMNNSLPPMSYDLNDYMRMLGVQNPPTSQQMAFFLNNMTITGQQPFDKKSNPLLFDMYGQQFPPSSMGYQGMDPASIKKASFQTWASTPNIHTSQAVSANSVPLGDFVASYTGANTKPNNTEKDDTKPKSCNPLYDSDDSNEGLSPKKTVARVQVKDFRPLPVRSESGKFMRKYASENFVGQSESNSQETNLSGAESVQFLRRQRSVSPSNSVSTVDSAITTSPSLTISTPSSPSMGQPASPVLQQKTSRSSTPSFRTVVDLSSPHGTTTQIISSEVDDIQF